MTEPVDGNPYAAPVATLQPRDAAFVLAGRVVCADRPVEWLKFGFALFKRDPGMWIALVVVVFLLLAVMHVVPGLGSLASSLLTPVFVAGLMVACKTQDEGGMPAIDHAFAGFREQTGPLVIAGLIFLVGVMIVFGVMLMFGGVAALGGIFWRGDAMGVGFAGFLLAALLFIPVAMAMYFAPVLIMVHRVAPMQALKASFSACLKNLVPFLVYGVIYVVLAALASIPAGLGWLVLGPVLIGALYGSYKDIFLSA